MTDIAQIFQRVAARSRSRSTDKGITSAADFEGKNDRHRGASATSGRSSPPCDGRSDLDAINVSITAGLQHERLPRRRHRRRAGDDLQRVGADPRGREPRHRRALPARGLQRHRTGTTSGTAMLQDAIWADTDRLDDDGLRRTQTVRVPQGRRSRAGSTRATTREEAAGHRVDRRAGSQLGPSHQLWMMNEVNKLIWPSTDGVGIIDEARLGPDGRRCALAPRTRRARRSSARSRRRRRTRTSTSSRRSTSSRTRASTSTGDDYTPIEVTLTEGGQ